MTRRVLLGEMRRGCQQAEEQLKMLIDYQNEYRSNLNTDMGNGIASNRWINYQQFIQTLEKGDRAASPPAYAVDAKSRPGAEELA
ncbi:flagellar FliJ protein [Salmonella enterica subsp. enterica serovar Hartford]|nr:flagellar FliJ protein [Salmonella enterica subsp. enterica serovar Hartford]